MIRTVKVLGMELQLALSYLRNFLFCIVVGIIIGIFLSNLELTQMMIFVYLLMFVGMPFAVAEKSGIDMLYLSLGVVRNIAVLGRYLFNLITAVILLALAHVLPLVLGAAGLIQYDSKVGLMTVTAFLAVYMLVSGLQLPIFFKMGYTSAKFLSYIPMLLIFAITMLSVRLDTDSLFGSFGLWLENNISLFGLIIIVLGAVVYGVSFFISCRIYSARDL